MNTIATRFKNTIKTFCWFKFMLLSGCFYLSTLNSQAQLTKQWDYRFGGTAIDEFHDVLSILDTNTFDTRAYLLAGYSESGANGDKTNASQGSGDFWLINVNSLGVKQWDKSYGGSNYDELFEVQQCADGGFILGGWSNSGISGDKSQASIGAGDYWVVRTNMSGTKLWDRTFGGTSEDYLQSVKQTSDGGFILAGRSNSGISGNKTGANRGTVGVTWDYWVVKIDAGGTKQWDQTYGGFDDDQLFAVQQTSDGGYILGGYSNSGITGEKSQASQGLDDYWIVKIDANGVKQWDKTFGGTSADQLQMVLQTSDGGYLLGGGSASGANGDKSQASRGNFDYWILKTNATGVKQWDKRFGGTSADNLFDAIQTTDGGYLLGGASSSVASGDKSQGNQGTAGTSYDYWVVKVDANGIAQVERRFGGSADDYAKSICETPDGNYLVAGWSTSGLTGDKSQASRGSIDYWFAKISGPNSITTGAIAGPECAGTSVSVNYTVTGTFNAGNVFTAQLSDSSGSFASPTTIGTLSSTTSGTINATLPFTFAASNYKIQVISSNPVAQDIYPSTAFQINFPISYYPDADNDGHGNAAGAATLSCTPLAGQVTNNDDCNDADPLVYQIPTGNDGVTSLSANCEGSSGNLFSCLPMQQATSYQWILSSGLSSAFVNNITPDTSISITIGLGAGIDSIGVAGKNSCGLSDTLYLILNKSLLPQAAGAISGDTQISSCINQLGITYSIPAIAHATNYVWTLPDSAVIIGNADTNSIVVNYSPYGVSGNISVYGSNSCGNGAAATINITFEAIPRVELCYITVDSASQKSLLWWQKPNEAQSDSIVIMRKNKGTSLFEKVATVKDTVPTSYLDLASDPTTIEGESYQLAVKDTCGNVGSFSGVIIHKTIYLYGLLGWGNFPKLYWTPYLGSNDTLRYYRVMRDTLGAGPFNILKDSIAFNSTLNYTDTSKKAATCPSCRYAIEMVYDVDCNPSARLNTLYRSTTRSNIKNKVAMPFDSTLLFSSQIERLQNSIMVYPNPAKERISFYSFRQLNNINIQLFDMLGNSIFYDEIEALKVGEQSFIKTEAFTRGIYLLKISDSNDVIIRKIILN
ncbi:MAG: T9SS type A sorting domain-containing protein [Bacteroidetes bacterium]|nr:T9SS type A sorting domain-containing protein [Bacteroidota bacterium]